MIDNIEVLGLMAGFCTTFSAIPQIKKILKTKSPADIAYLMCVMNCVGNALWITYALNQESISLLIANTITFILMATIIILKYRWDTNG